ncbi:Rieske (2Fe-2S) protein [Pseudonocardiaceae bacterium YIM PH 21723]|nr:Rieske (2Fe-2S) protein [Pseudonocardiaceae bacterium YIM PH 21723]
MHVPTTRRQVLCGLAALAVPALAACDSGTPAPAAAPGTPLAKVADIPIGGGTVVQVNGDPVLLVRESDTVVTGFNAACPHIGTPVNPPVNGVIVCPNHGSEFAAKDGALKKGPATVGLSPVKVAVKDGSVVTV